MTDPDTKPMSAAQVIQQFPGARLVTAMPHSPAPTSDDHQIALVGGFDRTYRRRLDRLGIWPHVTVIKRGEPIPPAMLHVVVTDNRSINALVGSAIGFDDVELWTLEGDLVTDGHRLIFCAGQHAGEYAWRRWWRFITEGHVGPTTMLPITCHVCEARHNTKYLSTRDARGIGWCSDHFIGRTVPEPPPGVAADDHDAGRHHNPDSDVARLDDDQRARARKRRIKLAKARAAINQTKQQTMETTDV